MEVLGVKFSGKVVKEKLYSPTDSPDKHQCNVCDAYIKQDTKNGYENLKKHSCSHLKNFTDEQMEVLLNYLRDYQPTLGFKTSVAVTVRAFLAVNVYGGYGAVTVQLR
jgi:hypothetical protein